MSDETSVYGKQWDSYVDWWSEVRGTPWPGDEWGSPEQTETIFRIVFPSAGVDRWERAVEVGPGAGKYTEKVLTHSSAAVRAYDVSPRFLEVCQERCEQHIASGRLSTHLLEGKRPDEIVADLAACGWKRKVDGFFSVDAMVHVDLQYLIAYLITAAAVLKPAGKLVLSVANAASGAGFQLLLDCISRHWRDQVEPLRPGKFEWLSPDLIASTLDRVGFELDRFDVNDRNSHIFLTATLARPEVGEELEQYLRLPEPS